MRADSSVTHPTRRRLIRTADGVFRASFTERGLARLEFPASREPPPATESSATFPGLDQWTRLTAAALADALLGRAPTTLPPLDLSSGTPFQQRVWAALRRIALGKTSSYQDIARAIGRPRSVRAVGNACGANPIAVLIPCHRVLQKNGGLGGFSSPLKWKRLLLAREASAAL